MLGRYEPIETMRSWPSNGLRVGAVREQWPVVHAASNMGMEPRAHARGSCPALDCSGTKAATRLERAEGLDA